MIKCEPIAVIEFSGNVDRIGGQSRGHYTCDVKDKDSKQWFRTNDNNLPVPIDSNDISCFPYVVLYRKTSHE